MFPRCILPPLQICIPEAEDRKRLPAGPPRPAQDEPPALSSSLSVWLMFSSLLPQMEPKRLKKQLPKLLKLLRPSDRVLIVGTTRRPFDAEPQPFCRVYQKVILVPRPDYASRYGKYPGCL